MPVGLPDFTHNLWVYMGLRLAKCTQTQCQLPHHSDWQISVLLYFFNLLVCCDLSKVVFREELKRRFHADFCSLAFCTYILLCIALVVLPFIIAFFSHCKCADNRMYHAHYVVALLSDSCTYVLNLRSTSERSAWCERVFILFIYFLLAAAPEAPTPKKSNPILCCSLLDEGGDIQGTTNDELQS